MLLFVLYLFFGCPVNNAQFTELSCYPKSVKSVKFVV